MRIEGNPEVLKNLFRKQRLLEAGNVDHLHYRTAVQGNPGGMAVIHAAGHALALKDHKLTDSFDTGAGFSGGLLTLLFLFSNRMEEGMDMFLNEATRREFISITRFLAGRGPIVDMAYLAPIIRKRLEGSKLNRTNLFGGVTCALTGKGVLLNAKEVQPDPVQLVHGSMTIPSKWGATEVGEHLALDGAGMFTFPVRQVMELGCTDLLVFASRTGITRFNMHTDKVVAASIRRHYPKPVWKAFATRHERALAELQYLRSQQECRYLIVWSDKDTGIFETNSKKLLQIAEQERKDFSALLARAKTEVEKEAMPLAAE